MTQFLRTQIHASCVDFAGTGLLLRGSSGSGKSDLALRMIDGGARLVADDRTDLTVEGGRLVASAPPTIAGRLEVRGLGIVDVPAVPRTPVGLVVDLVAPADVERMPEARRCAYLGVEVPLLAIAPFECSAPAKLRLALREAASGRLAAA
jgi:HPr kinase/phosphorylase